MKKILFISPLPPPHYGSAMSSEACLKILRDSPEFEVRGIKVNYSKSMRDIGKITPGKIKGLFYVKKQIRKELRGFSPNLVYFVPATSGFGLIRDSIFAKEIKKHYSRPILFHIRSRILEKDWSQKSKRERITEMLRGNKSIVLGDSLVSDIHGVIPQENISILPNAIENEVSEEEFTKIMRYRKNKHDTLRILFLSNMDETKGWPKLLEACNILRNKGKEFGCYFVGEFPGKKEEEYFSRCVKDHNLDKHAFYLGKKTGKEKNLALSESDILAFPTDYPLETFGRVILEGMMFGMPVIANGVATIPDTIIDGKTGFVLRDNSPEEISEKIERLIEDKSLRIKMGEFGRKRFLSNYLLSDYSKRFKRIILES